MFSVFNNRDMKSVNPELWGYLKRKGFTGGETFSLKMQDGGYGKFFVAKHFVLILGSSAQKNEMIFVQRKHEDKYRIAKEIETLPVLDSVDSYFLDSVITDKSMKLYSNFYRDFFTQLMLSLDNSIVLHFSGSHFFDNLMGRRLKFNAIAERICKKYQIPVNIE